MASVILQMLLGGILRGHPVFGNSEHWKLYLDSEWRTALVYVRAEFAEVKLFLDVFRYVPNETHNAQSTKTFRKPTHQAFGVSFGLGTYLDVFYTFVLS